MGFGKNGLSNQLESFLGYPSRSLLLSLFLSLPLCCSMALWAMPTRSSSNTNHRGHADKPFFSSFSRFPCLSVGLFVCLFSIDSSVSLSEWHHLPFAIQNPKSSQKLNIDTSRESACVFSHRHPDEAVSHVVVHTQPRSSSSFFSSIHHGPLSCPCLSGCHRFRIRPCPSGEYNTIQCSTSIRLCMCECTHTHTRT